MLHYAVLHSRIDPFAGAACAPAAAGPQSVHLAIAGNSVMATRAIRGRPERAG